MHKVHCERNTVKCPKCDAKMNRLELEKHEAENHALKKCETCSVQFELRFFSAHDCPKKQVMCDFCEASFPKDQVRNHQIDCGNRTEECHRCKEFIKRRDYKEHVQARKCKDYAERLREKEQEKELKRRREAEERKKEAEERQKLENQIKNREAESLKKKREEEVRLEAERKNLEDRRKIGQNKGQEVRKPEEKVVRNVKEEAKSGVPRSKATTFNSSQKKSSSRPLEEKKPKPVAEPRVGSFNPKPSPKINSKPTEVKNTVIQAEDYADLYDIPDEIPPIPDTIDEDAFSFPPLRKRSPNPMTESRNLDEYEDQILQQVIAESKQDFTGFDDSTEEDIMKQVLLNSIKEK